MYGRSTVTTTLVIGILVVISVFLGVGLGFLGADRLADDSSPAALGDASSAGNEVTPAAPAATDTVTPTHTVPTAPTETATSIPSPTAEPSPTPEPTHTPGPTETATATAAPTVSPVGTLRVTARIALNVRVGPGMTYAILEPVRNGDELDVLGQNPDGSWLYVRLPDGDTGWVARQYTDFTEQAPVLPTPTPESS